MKRNWLLILIAVILMVVYAVYFTDWWQPKTIEIFHTSRMVHSRKHRGVASTEPSLIFGINRSLRLTEIKVVPLADYKTNPATLPLWHLVSDSNSVPTKAFTYGQSIRGLKPAVSGVRAEPLTNGVVYRIIVVAGQFEGHNDFELK